MITSGFSLSFNGKALLENSKEMLWNRNIFTVTTSTDGHGTMTASPMSGFAGTNVTLSNTPNANYGFSGYSITGATLTGNQFTLNNDVTAMANFNQTGITYYSNDTPFCVEVQQNHTIPLNIDVTPTNFVTIKYSARFYDNPLSYLYYTSFYCDVYSNELRKTKVQTGYGPLTGTALSATHYFKSYPNRYMTYTDTGEMRTIIDRSAHRYSSYYKNVLAESNYLTYQYWEDIVTPHTATADDLLKISGLYWMSTGTRGTQCVANIRIGGTTSFADAFNY